LDTDPIADRPCGRSLPLSPSILVNRQIVTVLSANGPFKVHFQTRGQNKPNAASAGSINPGKAFSNAPLLPGFAPGALSGAGSGPSQSVASLVRHKNSAPFDGFRKSGAGGDLFADPAAGLEIGPGTRKHRTGFIFPKILRRDPQGGSHPP
jgi:hypothetical protein